MTKFRISRYEFETETLAKLAKRHTRAAILTALDNFQQPASKKRRTPLNSGALLAVWVAVERKRDQSRNGSRHSIKRASELLAQDLKNVRPVPTGAGQNHGTVTPSPGWSRIKALHGEAAKKAEAHADFRKLLESALAEQAANLWPDDELLPMIFIGGPTLSGWLIASDHAHRPKKLP